MTAKKEDELTLEDFISMHLECLDDIKILATETDEGKTQPFCTNDVGAVEEILTRVLTACWNDSDDGAEDDTEEIETDLDEEIDEEETDD